MNILQAEWLPQAAVIAAAVLLALWLTCYLCALRPKKGTLEWIGRTGRRRFSAFAPQPVSGGGWVVFCVSAALGAAASLLQETYSPAQAAVNTIGTASFCLILLLTYGHALPALCGVGLMLVSGEPVRMLLPALLLLALLPERLPLRLILLFPSVLGVLHAFGSGPGTLLLLIGWCLLALLSIRLEGTRSVWSVVLELLLQLAVLAVAVAAEAVLFHAASESIPTRIVQAFGKLLEYVPAQISVEPVLLLCGMGAVPLLVQAIRLRESGWLIGAVFALLCLPQLLFGSPEIAWSGCIAALTGTFAGTDRRGGKLPAVLTTLLLICCILIS